MAAVVLATGVALVAAAITVGVTRSGDDSTVSAYPRATIRLPARVAGLDKTLDGLWKPFLADSVASVSTHTISADGAVYADYGEHQVVVVSAGTLVGGLDGQAQDRLIDSGWRRMDLTVKQVTFGRPRDRDPGRLGGRLSCVTFTGSTSGQVCVAVNASTLMFLQEFDQSSVDSPDSLARTVREAVIRDTP
jgi:hypothetical protein